MDKRIKMSDKDMINYYIREQKAMEYGVEFFKGLCRIDIKTIENEILPLCFYNQMDEFLHSIDIGDRMTTHGGFCYAGKKQAYIRIGIDTNNSILNKNFKQIIKHEIIHYYLWLVDLPFDDDSLEFWCLCYVYDGGAYEELSCEDEEYYKLFIEMFDTYACNLPMNAKSILIGQMISELGKTPIDDYKEFVIDIANKIKNLFSLH